jgi:mRNA interferase MazF
MIMPVFDVWDVKKGPFPYTNRPVQQHRPALVVGRHRQAGSPALLWVVMITSAQHHRWVGDVEISNLPTAGLPVSSIVRSAKIATIQTQHAERIGHLPVSDRPAVRARIAEICKAVLA